jgi:small subunit ribosomal protein S1
VREFTGGILVATNKTVKQFELPKEEIEKQLREALGESGTEALQTAYDKTISDFEPNTIIKGRVVNIIGDDVIVNVGYKSEGIIDKDQFFDQPVNAGDEIEVFLESVEDDSGMIVLSKKKADRIRAWERVISTYREGDIVRCRVMRKIKGGLLVDIGVPVFLPASQVGLRRAADIAEYIGQELECKIIKIDEGRMNIVVSRRRLQEELREEAKKKLFAELELGQMRKGVVKNIADFGAFVDLGGVDGLLHITDMSWGRISHPSEMVAIDDEIEIKVLKIDKERERISLGLKQKTPSPWVDVEEKYPVTARVKGQVVNILSYGAFVKLEDGIEGLVHVSEMSWTKRINHPSELVAIGDIVEVVVLDINKEKEEISLGMKQTEVNPWMMVEEKYPVGTIIEGRVRNLTNYGAFIELEEGIDGLLHVSDMSWTRKVAHPGEAVRKGDKIRAVVLTVDQEKKRVALGMKQLTEDPWEADIPTRYARDTIAVGRVTNVTNFGVFVELEKNLEGLLHISELADRRVDSASEVVKPKEIVEVRVIRLDRNERKIGLSLARVLPPEEAAQAQLGPKEIAPVAEPARAPEAERVEKKPEPVPQPGQYLLADQLKAFQEKKAKEQAQRETAEPEDIEEPAAAAAEVPEEPVGEAADEAPAEAMPAAEAPGEPVGEAVDEAPAEAVVEAPAEPAPQESESLEQAPEPAPAAEVPEEPVSEAAVEPTGESVEPAEELPAEPVEEATEAIIPQPPVEEPTEELPPEQEEGPLPTESGMF